MLSTISTKPVPYVVERERALADAEKTIFWIKQQTVDENIDNTAAYAKVAIQSRRKQRTEVDPQAYKATEQQEWLSAVLKIENVRIIPESPGNAYDHFAMRAASEPSKYKQEDGAVVVNATDNADDLRYIYKALEVSIVEEVIGASKNMTELKAGERNFSK